MILIRLSNTLMCKRTYKIYDIINNEKILKLFIYIWRLH